REAQGSGAHSRSAYGRQILRRFAPKDKLVMLNLIENETLKVLRRKRFTVVVAILFAIIAIVTYSQHERLLRERNRNWRAEIQQRIANYENALRRGRMNETWSRSLRAEVSRLQFYLDHDIEPDKPTAPFLPRGGWGAPTFTGFTVARGAVNIDAVRQLPLWKDALIAYGLEWYALLTVASIALLLSVLFRSSAAAIGTMLASLVGGTIL